MDDGISPTGFEDEAGDDGWRVVEDGATACYPTASFSAGARFAQAIGNLDGVDDHPPEVDLRADGVTVRLITITDDWFGPTRRDLELAHRITALAREHGLAADQTRVQSVLIIPGAPATAAILPFWRAVLGYEPRPDSPEEDLVDPRRRNPPFWFEEMDEPRGDGGGAIHIAVWVPRDQAEARVAAAIAAGGRIVRDDQAPSWWTLADAAGNEADVASIAGRG